MTTSGLGLKQATGPKTIIASVASNSMGTPPNQNCDEPSHRAKKFLGGSMGCSELLGHMRMLPFIPEHSSALGWPFNAGKLFGQLRRVGWINERHIRLGCCTQQQFHFLRRSDDDPEHLRVRIVKHLSHLLRTDQHAT